jgi:hypothetical protein
MGWESQQARSGSVSTDRSTGPSTAWGHKGAGEEKVSSVPIAGSPIDDLPMNAKKEHFSLSFVHMIVYAAGFSVKTHETDYDGVDITIASSAGYSVYYCPEFELQLKCTSRRDLLTDEYLKWQMEGKPFRKLTNPKRYNRAYLGVLLVPDDAEPWVEQDETRLLTNSRMYWQGATDLGTIDDSGPSCDQVTVPAQDRVRADQQPQPT